MTKNIAIEVERIKYLNTGLGNFCLNFIRSLEANRPLGINCVYMLNKDAAPADILTMHNVVHLAKYHRLFNRFAPAADVWHLTHQDSRYLPPKNKTPILLTIHDLNFIYTKKSAQRIARRKKLPSIAATFEAIA